MATLAINKEDKRTAMLISLLFAIFLIIVCFFIGFSYPPKQQEVVEIIFETAGSKSSGGSSSSEVSETTKTEVEEVTAPTKDPVVTQKDDSPVTESSKTSSKSNTSKSNEPKVNNNALFPGSGSGSGTGNTNGNGDGDNGSGGDGVNGPGVSGRIGKLGGRRVVYTPKITNPVHEEGVVMVEITVNQSGKVVSATALPNHPKTTSNNPSHIATAQRKAKDIKYASNSSGKELEKGIVPIKFTLQ